LTLTSSYIHSQDTNLSTDMDKAGSLATHLSNAVVKGEIPYQAAVDSLEREMDDIILSASKLQLQSSIDNATLKTADMEYQKLEIVFEKTETVIGEYLLQKVSKNFVKFSEEAFPEYLTLIREKGNEDAFDTAAKNMQQKLLKAHGQLGKRYIDDWLDRLSGTSKVDGTAYTHLAKAKQAIANKDGKQAIIYAEAAYNANEDGAEEYLRSLYQRGYDQLIKQGRKSEAKIYKKKLKMM